MFQDLGTTQEVQKYIDDGWQIHYAPLSGGVGLWSHDGRWTNISIKSFLELRQIGYISLSSTMRHGHDRFHGRVDIYKKKNNS